MKLKISLLVLFAVLFTVSGCFFAPWEDCEYDSLGDTPQSHYEALESLTEWGRPLENFRLDGVICSVMIQGTGCYPRRKGPYTVWVMIAAIGDRKGSGPDRSLTLNRVCVSQGDETVYETKGIPLPLKSWGSLHARFIMRGDCRIPLPDVLNPKGGQFVRVRMEVSSKTGESKTFVFDFRPKVTSGYFQCVG